MTDRFIRTLGAIILVTALTPASVNAQQALPAFTVLSSAGVVVSSDRLSAAERWLLIYLVPGTVVSDRLLHALDERPLADGSRIVVLAAGPASIIDASIRPLLTNSPAAVYADPDGRAGRALGVNRGPALVGVANRKVDWMIQGVLNDPRLVEPVIRNWLQLP